MKNLFLLSLLISIFCSCSESKKEKIVSSVDTTAHLLDTKEADSLSVDFLLDTVHFLYIGKKTYRLALGYGDSQDSLYGSKQNSIVTLLSGLDTLYYQKFNFNTIGEIENPAPGCYWILLYDYGGGSGFSGTLFNIRIDPKVILQPIANVNELAWWTGNKRGKELVLFEGFWHLDTEEEDFEGHFSEHKQNIFVGAINADTVVFKDIGMTKYKYDFTEGKKALEEFQKKEPDLNKVIDWRDQ